MTHLTDQDRRGKMVACLQRLTAIMDLLAENGGWLSLEEISETVSNVHQRTVRRDLKALLKVGWIEANRFDRLNEIGNCGSRYYHKYRAKIKFTAID